MHAEPKISLQLARFTLFPTDLKIILIQEISLELAALLWVENGDSCAKMLDFGGSSIYLVTTIFFFLFICACACVFSDAFCTKSNRSGSQARQYHKRKTKLSLPPLFNSVYLHSNTWDIT